MDIPPINSVSISSVATTISNVSYVFFSLFLGDPEKVVLRDVGDWRGLVLATYLKGIRVYRQNEWNTMSFFPFFHKKGT